MTDKADEIARNIVERFTHADEKSVSGILIEAITAAIRSCAAEIEAERDRLRVRLQDLSDAERNYRMTHDIEGDGHIDTGRAWDRMRKAGDRARAALSSPTPEGSGG